MQPPECLPLQRQRQPAFHLAGAGEAQSFRLIGRCHGGSLRDQQAGEHDRAVRRQVARDIGRERAEVIIANCMHADFRDQARDYFTRALKRGGQTPHLLNEAFEWYDRLEKTGSMKG